MSFKVGDKVVYPNHGVGVIEEVKRRAIGDEESSFYCLRILSTDSTVMVPVNNTQAVGLRKVLTRREVTRVVKVLKDDGRTDSGLYLPDGAKELHNEALYGEVIEVARDKPTTTQPAENVSGVPNGSKVLFKKEAGVRVPWGDGLRLLEVKDILATVEEHLATDAH